MSLRELHGIAENLESAKRTLEKHAEAYRKLGMPQIAEPLHEVVRRDLEPALGRVAYLQEMAS